MLKSCRQEDKVNPDHNPLCSQQPGWVPLRRAGRHGLTPWKICFLPCTPFPQLDSNCKLTLNARPSSLVSIALPSPNTRGTWCFSGSDPSTDSSALKTQQGGLAGASSALKHPRTFPQKQGIALCYIKLNGNEIITWQRITFHNPSFAKHRFDLEAVTVMHSQNCITINAKKNPASRPQLSMKRKHPPKPHTNSNTGLLLIILI